MNIKKVIFSTLCIGQLPSCGDCGDYIEQIQDQPIYQSDVQYLMENHDIYSIEDLEVNCHLFCSDEYMYYTENMSRLSYCSMKLDLRSLQEDTGIEDTGLDTGEDVLSDTADPYTEDAEYASTIIGSVSCRYKVYQECQGGRRPLGYVESELSDNSLGGYFAGCAHMEAASIGAFVELARQLQSWNAPSNLQKRCISAAKDEILHSHLFAQLARQEGLEIPPIHQHKVTPDLFTAALHNATEGCIMECWAALLAHYQAIHASTERLRAIYSRIAMDECRHGQLSWDIHQWFLQQLSEEEQQKIKKAQQTSLKQLLANTTQSNHHIAHNVGLPSREEKREIMQRFQFFLAA